MRGNLIAVSSLMKTSQTCQRGYNAWSRRGKGQEVSIPRGQSQKETGTGKEISIMAEQFQTKSDKSST